MLSVATGSAFSLLPIAIKALGGWLFGDDEENRPEHPILTEDEESLALAHVRADSRVLDAVLRQRGRTVVLSLVVPPDTSPDIARELGERFAVLVKAFSSTEPEPDDEIGAGDFDYLVRSAHPPRPRSPSEARLRPAPRSTGSPDRHGRACATMRPCQIREARPERSRTRGTNRYVPVGIRSRSRVRPVAP